MSRTGMIGSTDIAGNYYRTATRKSEHAEDFDALLQAGDGREKQLEAARVRSGETAPAKSADKPGEDTAEPKSYREQILEKMEEMMKNIKNGTIQPKFRIGAQEFTVKEWEKFLEKFDAAEEVMREEVEAQIEELKELAEEEAARRAAMFGMPEPAKMTEESEAPAAQSVVNTGKKEKMTTASEINVKVVDVETADTKETDVKDAAELLTNEITKCSYPTNDPKQKHWYITAYGQDGISCKEAYFDGTRWVNKDLWSLSYTQKGQYEKVMAFLERFPQDANLRFAAHKNFWIDFLAGEIDEDDFAAFFETTRDGVPDYTYEKDGSTYIDRDKVKYAKYMNDFGAQMYTAEEMELILQGIIHENRKNMTQLSYKEGTMTAPAQNGDERKPENKEDEIETKFVTKPDGSTVLQIKTKYGVTEVGITQAQKFGLLLDVRDVTVQPAMSLHSFGRI